MHEDICFELLLLLFVDMFLLSYTWKVWNVNFVYECCLNRTGLESKLEMVTEFL